MKIIYCGFFKTGSRSISDFIHKTTGYKHYVGESIDLHTHPTDVKFGPGMFQLNPDDSSSCIHMGMVNDKKIYDFLEDHNDMIARDFPYFGMYKHINETYPESKFIICIRDTESLVKSYVKYFNSMGLRVACKFNKAILDINGPTNYERDSERIKLVYEAHNHRVLEYFKDKPGKLLVLDFKDIGTDKFEKEILDFINVENNENIKMKDINV